MRPSRSPSIPGGKRGKGEGKERRGGREGRLAVVSPAETYSSTFPSKKREKGPQTEERIESRPTRRWEENSKGEKKKLRKGGQEGDKEDERKGRREGGKEQRENGCPHAD